MPVRVIETGLPSYQIRDDNPLTSGIASASQTLLDLAPKLAQIQMQQKQHQDQLNLRNQEMDIQRQGQQANVSHQNQILDLQRNEAANRQIQSRLLDLSHGIGSPSAVSPDEIAAADVYRRGQVASGTMSAPTVPNNNLLDFGTTFAKSEPTQVSPEWAAANRLGESRQKLAEVMPELREAQASAALQTAQARQTAAEQRASEAERKHAEFLMKLKSGHKVRDMFGAEHIVSYDPETGTFQMAQVNDPLAPAVNAAGAIGVKPIDIDGYLK